MTRRTERVNELLREEISELLRRQVKDPRVSGLVTVTAVEVTPDLGRARVYISVLGSEEERSETFRALDSAAPFLRRQLSQRLSLRRTPSLIFQRDDSLERGAHLLALLDEVATEGKSSE
jgi:ribosome-binding factor A